jgi:hypothetical protein
MRLGDIFRVLYIGKRSKATLLVLSSVLFERFTDILLVLGSFCLLFLLTWSDFGILNTESVLLITESIVNSIQILISIAFVLIIIIINAKALRLLIYSLFNVFSVKLKLNSLSKIFEFIFLNGLMFRNLAVKKYIWLTICMWLFYFTGYYCAMVSAKAIGLNYGFIEIFLIVSNPIDLSGLIDYLNLFNSQIVSFTLTGLFKPILYLIPALFLFAYSYRDFLTYNTIKPIKTHLVYTQNRSKINFRNDYDQDIFLKNFFYSSNNSWSKAYIEIFGHNEILADYSGLSDANVVLAQDKDNYKFYRKYVLDSNNLELKNQFEIMKKLSNFSHFPEVKAVSNTEFFYYDMPYKSNYFPLNFGINYVKESNKSTLINNIFDALDQSLYSQMSANLIKSKIFETYYSEKIIKNLHILEGYLHSCNFKTEEEIVINHTSLFMSYVKIIEWYVSRKDRIFELFLSDTLSLSHGDLSAENIIINPSNLDFYFIDLLSSNNNLSSKSNDLAKLKLSSSLSFESIRSNSIVPEFGNNIIFMTSTNPGMLVLDNSLNLLIEQKRELLNKSLINLYSAVHLLRVISRRIKSGDLKTPAYISHFFQLQCQLQNSFKDI